MPLEDGAERIGFHSERRLTRLHGLGPVNRGDKERHATSPSTWGVLLAMICLGGCMPELPPSAFDGGTPEMRPEVFFAGMTRSSGVLENRLGAPTQRFHVEGLGQMLPDGSFRLQQSLTFGGDAPEMRTWMMRRLDAHHYTASLTDASGAVEGEAYGNLFHLRYPMQTPFGGWMEQWLYLQPDGRTVMNQATIRVFGLTMAHLSERISHEAR
jgi:hypothetical protein